MTAGVFRMTSELKKLLYTPLRRGAFIGQTQMERLWARVGFSPGNCWEWLGQKTREGYGRLALGTKGY